MSTGEIPRLPGTLRFARSVFVGAGLLLLLAHTTALVLPGSHDGAPVEPGTGSPVVDALAWLAPVVMLAIALRIPGGGVGVRISLAFVVVLLVTGSLAIALQDIAPRDVASGTAMVLTFAGAAGVPLLYAAVVALFLPSSNAYVQRIRLVRFATREPLGPPPAPRPR